MRANLILLLALLGLVVLPGCDKNEISTEIEKSEVQSVTQVVISTRAIDLIKSDGLEFRDLNKNSVIDPYEDWRLSPTERADDLLSRMTLEEKVGQLAHGNIVPEGGLLAKGAGYNLPVVEVMVLNQHMTSLIPFPSLNYLEFVGQNNAVQEIAEKGRLGIPVTISTDPRHHFMTLTGASISGEGFSQWPEPLGFAALDDEELVYQFAQIAAREYRATGFGQALSPQADLSTEPRWARINHTFGEDSGIASRMVAAYIRGFQGSNEGVQYGQVPTVVKHWVGYGAVRDGFDSHSYYGRFSDLTEENFATHVTPFQAAFDVQVSGVMPAYSIFEDLTVNGSKVESVGAAYSKVLIDDLLRKKHNFEGVILSDWMITEDCPEACINGAPPGQQPNPMTDISTAWGVLDLTKAERFALAMKVGVDQFGGVMDVSPIFEAVEKKLIDETRIDESVRRILKKTIASGLFESPFADVETAKTIVNSQETQKLALEAQSRALVMLKRDVDGVLLTEPNQKLYLVNAEAEDFEEAGYVVVNDITLADVAIVRLHAPYETLHPNYFFGMFQHEGNLAFDPQGEDVQLLKNLKDSGVRTIVDVSLDRPAVLTDIVEFSDVLIANFGASDLALLRALNGTIAPEGKLPFELPSSMEAVEEQDSGKPADSKNPLFPLHYSVDS